MTAFKIGELAAAAGVGRDTIRYYERTGLLPTPDRTSAGYRLYGDVDLLRLNFIRSAQWLGFTLAETSELLALKASDTAKASAVLDITLEKIREAEARIERLTDIRDVLRALADDCPVDVPVTDCPILTFLSTRHDSRRTEAHT
ncbi:heavy metal-responsive transcriptional regulator [Sphingobium sp. GW456-12-10-14-TSB1]|uniref:heavy metal-responsive transcriptional regulator n=1 Tax=unclassified Sphingobium TaxID=2611147 RepID=UPI000A3A8937|nr:MULTISPECIES: heavy metal-responsive transcriptional regulator [unclassified Sphingobium]MBS88191.1 heavy metal-responsive transcriptional regulator [Sphingobium sp.]OUC54493.1 heavy metal-responsive transcriptional regulator [Sphingobium sp. GW456-12-10-14-TSB1]